MKTMLATLAVLVITQSAQAGLVNFTAEEIKTHQKKIDIITSNATTCLQTMYATHVRFYNEWGVSKYYGERKREHQTRAGLAAELRKFGAPAELIDELEPTACISMALKCLKQGFVAAGTGATYDKIHAYLMIDQKVYGTDLQIMLQQLGWKILYFNPDPKMNTAWDEEDKRIFPAPAGKNYNPAWGSHAYNYASVIKKGIYYHTKVDDAKTLVGFGTAVPAAFTKLPFFVGIAHSGYHVFPGYQGRVIEAHSTRSLDSFANLEVSMFNPIHPDGGPRWTKVEHYRSGLIAVPPAKVP